MICISKYLLLTQAGHYHDTIDAVNMLWGMRQRSSDGVVIYESLGYYTPMCEGVGLHIANSVIAPYTALLRPYDSVELLSS